MQKLSSLKGGSLLTMSQFCHYSMYFWHWKNTASSATYTCQ